MKSLIDFKSCTLALGGRGLGRGGKKEVAFTLAEVLITLGIIGIVAAMTIPTLMSNYAKKRTATQLKATYATIANAVRLSEADNGEVSGWNFSNKSEQIIDEYLLPYIKASKRNYKPHSFSYKFANGADGNTLDIVTRDTVVYTLLSGAEIITSQINKERQHLSLVVDINGVESPPNKLGRDTFYIIVHPTLGVRMSQNTENEIKTGKYTIKSRKVLKDGPSQFNYHCTGLGVWCGALIERDGWTISKDYPWK